MANAASRALRRSPTDPVAAAALAFFSSRVTDDDVRKADATASAVATNAASRLSCCTLVVTPCRIGLPLRSG